MSTVLVVEDDATLRTSVTRTLERRGCQCVPQESAEDAAAAFHHEAVDMLLLDLHLPGLDGWSFLRQLRRERERPGGRSGARRGAPRHSPSAAAGQTPPSQSTSFPRYRSAASRRGSARGSAGAPASTG